MGILKLRIKKYKVVSFCSISTIKNFENFLKFWMSRLCNLRFLSFFVEETLFWNFEEKRCAGRTTNQKRKAISPKFKLKIWWYYIFCCPLRQSRQPCDLLTRYFKFILKIFASKYIISLFWDSQALWSKLDVKLYFDVLVSTGLTH